jgi:hypothetical protein
MPKSDKPSAGRRPRPGASPVGAGAAHSADATIVVTFSALSEAQWQAIRPARENWPDGTDWRSLIEQAGRHFWEWQAERKMWLSTGLRGKPARERKKEVDGVLGLTRQLQKAWTDSGLNDADLPDPGLKLREQRAEVWLYHYGTHVSPYAGQSDPIQEHLYWQLMSIWIDAGGQLDYSRKKDDAGTPYGPLVDFLALTLEAVLDKTYQPSGIARIIERHRPQIAKARGLRRRRRSQRLA